MNKRERVERARYIRAFIALKGWTVKNLASSIGVSRQFLSEYIHGHKGSKRVEDALVERGLPRHRITTAKGDHHENC